MVIILSKLHSQLTFNFKAERLKVSLIESLIEITKRENYYMLLNDVLS